MNTRPKKQATCHPDKLMTARGLCKGCYDLGYYSQNKEKVLKRRMTWARNNPKRVNAARIKYRYGITQTEYDAKVVEQDGLCAICKLKPQDSLHIDHRHADKKVRGLLCGDCNRAIGLLRENPANLLAAVEYLSRWT